MRRATLMLAILLVAPLPAEAAGPSIEQRLQRAEDDLAIRRLLVDYSWTQDNRDFAAYAALFARNGEWVNGATVRKGRDEILKMLVGLYGETPPGFVNRESFHITSNPEVDIDGDPRHLLVMRGPDGSPRPMLAGRYEDELIREDGTWKILRRIDYPIMPTAEEWREIMRALRG